MSQTDVQICICFVLAETGEVCIIEASSLPVVFCQVGNKLCDDLVIEDMFPCGQDTLLDAVHATKLL